MRNRSKLLSVMSCIALLGAACSGSNAEPGEEEVVEAEPSPTPDPTCPLTGEAPPKGVDLSRPAIALKIENSPAARPQAGLEHADVVFEEVVEGGITRFMALYHCGGTEIAGPVRSARFDDPKIAKPFSRLIAFSGANGIVKAELQAQGMVLVEELTSPPGLFREPPGVLQVHNLFADTEKLRKTAEAENVKPPKDGVFTFEEDLEAKSKKARLVRVNFLSASTIEYRWKGGEWKRSEAGAPFMTVDGDQLSVPNVLIQEVDVNNSPTIRDSAGNASPDIALVGEGKALLFRGGRVVKGTWEIKKEGAPPVYRTKAGDEMPFAPGRIIIELVPSQKGSVKGTFSFQKKRV
jgi:hypothetical protein